MPKLKKPVGNSQFLTRQWDFVIVILLIHLAYCVFALFGVLLMMGYASEREGSLGVSAFPYLVLGFTAIIAFILFILTLVFFIMRNKKYRTFASIAGIGGSVVTLGVYLISPQLDAESFGQLLLILFLFMTPMIAVFLYDSYERGSEQI